MSPLHLCSLEEFANSNERLKPSLPIKEQSYCRLQHLSSDPLNDADVRGIIFLVRSRIENAQLVAEQVKLCIG